MMGDTHVGILGLGLFLPPEIRRNDWWPRDVVAGWMTQRSTGSPGVPSATSEGAARVIAAMSKQAIDPFQGAVERRVMPADMSHSDMEEHAARAALANAGIAAADVDLIFVNTLIPDYLATNLACVLHHRLGLPTACFAMQTDAAQYTFIMQVALAEAMIRAGRARNALVVQSSSASRVINATDPISPLFGDGATAAVIGHVSDRRGVLSVAHHADGSDPYTLVVSVTGGTCSDEGKLLLHLKDQVGIRKVLLGTADVMKEAIGAALARAGVTAPDVDFFCMHQGTPWLREVVQEHAGLTRARSFDTFERTAHLHGALIPSKLAAAQAEGHLGDGDLVVLAGGGTGQVYGAMVMRWGR